MVKRVLLSPPGRNYYPMDDIFIYSSRQVVNSLCEPSLKTSGWQLLQKPQNILYPLEMEPRDGRLESRFTSYPSFAIAVKLFFVQIDVGCYLLASSDISKLGKLTYRLLILISVNLGHLGQRENVLSFQLLQTRISLFSTVLSLRFCGHPLF